MTGRHYQQYFSYIVAVSFIGGENRGYLPQVIDKLYHIMTALCVTFHSAVLSPCHSEKTKERSGDNPFNLVLSLWCSLVPSSRHNEKTTERN
jgi:hypothetical protein